MADSSTVPASGPSLSRVRTFLFGAFVVVWFSETMFLGVPALTRVWTQMWQVELSGDPLLATALTTVWSCGAPGKGALLVLALFGLFSRSPSARTALFVSMALVPPLNIAFQFRYQGFLPGPMTVATVLSTILWGSFLLFRERAPRHDVRSEPAPRSRGDLARRLWFAGYTVAVTLLALLFLLRPRTAVALALPCLSATMRAPEEVVSSLIHTGLATGTHLAAVAVALWLGTIRWRSDPALRSAVAMGGLAHAGLFVAVPLRQIALTQGTACAVTSVLIAFVPLFAGWLLYVARREKKPRPQGSGPVPTARPGSLHQSLHEPS